MKGGAVAAVDVVAPAILVTRAVVVAPGVIVAVPDAAVIDVVAEIVATGIRGALSLHHRTERLAGRLKRDHGGEGMLLLRHGFVLLG